MPEAPLLHPLDAGLMEIKAPPSGLQYPPPGWIFLQFWGSGHAFQHRCGLRLLIDCSMKDDNQWWVHISVSRRAQTPDHEDMAMVKSHFLGERYAYSVWPPLDKYVNIHANCLHIWALVDKGDGRILPEFSDIVEGVGRSI